MLQFSKNLTAHRKKTQFGKKHDMLKRDEEDFQNSNRQICQKIFNKELEIEVNRYLDLRDDIQQLLWHYEFHQYDTDENDGTISAFDFAQSLLVYFPFNSYEEYYSHIQSEGKHLKEGRVTYREFIAF